MIEEDPAASARSRQSAQRRARMAVAATELLVEQGPSAVTHRQVSARAGLPAGSANYYFPTRDELYAAAVHGAEDRRADLAADLAETLTAHPGDLVETARNLIRVLYAPRVDADIVARRLGPMLDAARSPKLQRILHDSRPRLLAAMTRILERSGHPDLPAADVALLAESVDAALLYAAATGAGDPRDVAAAHVARILGLLVR